MRRCWSLAPHRPRSRTATNANSCMSTAPSSLIEGDMDWMISQKMNAEQMTLFLSQVSAAHPEDFHRHGAGRRQFTKPRIFGGLTTSVPRLAPMPLNSTPGASMG